MTLNVKDLKQGDVIFTINKYGDESIAIYSHTIEDNRLELYARYLYSSNILWFSTDATYTEIRMATEEEKIKLYDALCVRFDEDYDSEWTKHFSDDSYHDVLDYLLEVFNIEVDETLCTTSWYPSFVHEIQNYIWDKMCEFMGQSNKTGFTEVEEEPEEKMVSLDAVCEWLYNNWKGEDYYASDIIEGLRKAMEE